MTDALELMGKPCILFDDLGRVLSINGPADKLVGGMISLKSQTLAFGDPQSQSKFNSILAVAMAEMLGPPQRAIALVRNRLGGRHVVRAVGLRGWARYAFTGARALVIFEEARPSASATFSLLRGVFGLTAAEARLATELFAGNSVARAADNLGITYETARSCLKAIFMKTDTHRQAELVTLLVRYMSV
jgi:DNA-binding CsgD family transcriptional regulator